MKKIYYFVMICLWMLGVAGGIIIVSVLFGIVMDRIAVKKRKKANNC